MNGGAHPMSKSRACGGISIEDSRAYNGRVARKPVPRRATPRRKRGVVQKAEQGIEHLAEVIESRLLDAGQVATGTTSAEVNLAAAAMEAIEGAGTTESGPVARRALPRPRPKTGRKKSRGS